MHHSHWFCPPATSMIFRTLSFLTMCLNPGNICQMKTRQELRRNAFRSVPLSSGLKHLSRQQSWQKNTRNYVKQHLTHVNTLPFVIIQHSTHQAVKSFSGKDFL